MVFSECAEASFKSDDVRMFSQPFFCLYRQFYRNQLVRKAHGVRYYGIVFPSGILTLGFGDGVTYGVLYYTDFDRFWTLILIQFGYSRGIPPCLILSFFVPHLQFHSLRLVGLCGCRMLWVNIRSVHMFACLEPHQGCTSLGIIGCITCPRAKYISICTLDFALKCAARNLA